MKTHRLFIGTFIDQNIFKDVYDDIYNDFNGTEGGKWIELQNLHFAYKFIGDVATTELPILKNIIGETLRSYNSALTIKGIGVFPNVRRPRILYAHIDQQSNILTKIYNELDNKLIQMGLEKENRKFQPYITLKRIKELPQENFTKMLFKYREHQFGIMKKFKVDLIESVLSQDGPEYCIVED